MRAKSTVICDGAVPYRESLSPVFVTVITVAVGIGCSLGFGLGGLHLMGDSWMQYNEVSNSYFTMTPAALVGVYLVMASVALGPSLLGLSLISITRLQPLLDNKIPLLFLKFIIAAGIIICVIISGVYLIDAYSPYIWYQPQDGVPLLNTLNQLCGCLLVSAYTVLSAASLCSIAESFHLFKCKPLVATASSQPNNKLSARFNMTNFGVLLSSFGLIFLLTLFLPHVWAITYMPVIAWNAYFVHDSPFSLVHGVILYQNEVEHFSYQNFTETNMTTGANITVTEYLPDPDWLQPMIFLKLYETVVVYYSVIFFIIGSGIVGTYCAPVRRYLHKRVDMWFIPKQISLWPFGASIGEILLTCTVIALHCYWFWYWAVGWSYRAYTVEESGTQFGLETYARVMGQMSILTMSFLTFPVAHNSVWESVFGVPFDRAIKYHRAMGALFWIFATLHMMLYEIKWIQRGVLIQNAWSEPNNWIVEGTADDPLIFRNSNWTIAMMEFTWLLGTVTMSAALLRTTFRYELFVYTHIFMALFFILTFLHSFQSWYYTGAGLLLYAFDKAIRFINASRQHSMLSLTFHADPGVTRVVLPGGTFKQGHTAGQFCWIQIPAVSAFEWHPFTISSSPAQALGEEGTVMFSIKALTPGSWTHRLGEFAEKCAIENTPLSAMDIALDGPYGRSLNYSEHKTVVLVAGGIGVTPMISTFDELAGRMGDVNKGSAGSVRQVHLVWSMREASLFDLFALEALTPIVLKTPGVYLHLYITGTPQFVVLSPKDILRNIAAQGKSAKATGGMINSRRISLSMECEYGIERCESPIPVKTKPEKSTHNVLESLLEQEGARLGGPDGAKAADSEPSSNRLANFSVTFSRPNYGALFDMIDKINIDREGEGEVEDEASSKGVGEGVGVPPLVRSRHTNSGVACMVCAPLVAVESISQLCYKKNWDFQAEEFAI